MKKAYIANDESIVSDARLTVLRQKEMAHDAILEAHRDMSGTQSQYLAMPDKGEYELGWLDCFSRLNETIVAYSARIVDITDTPREYASVLDRTGLTDMDDLPF